jgi:hypothetical protein
MFLNVSLLLSFQQLCRRSVATIAQHSLPAILSDLLDVCAWKKLYSQGLNAANFLAAICPSVQPVP